MAHRSLTGAQQLVLDRLAERPTEPLEIKNLTGIHRAVRQMITSDLITEQWGGADGMLIVSITNAGLEAQRTGRYLTTS